MDNQVKYTEPTRLTYAEAAELGEWLDAAGERQGDPSRAWRPEEWLVHGVRVSLDNGFVSAGRWMHGGENTKDVSPLDFIQFSVSMEVSQRRHGHVQGAVEIARELFGESAEATA